MTNTNPPLTATVANLVRGLANALDVTVAGIDQIGRLLATAAERCEDGAQLVAFETAARTLAAGGTVADINWDDVATDIPDNLVDHREWAHHGEADEECVLCGTLENLDHFVWEEARTLARVIG